MNDDVTIKFVLPEVSLSIIKVVGVGGGGGNAVNYMYEQGIRDVTYALCNTDNQALIKSPIQDKVQLGINVTNGLGAGNKPELAKEAALESEEQIRKMFSDGTRMAFITAGMGGGTGTGAAPVVASVAKSLGILTVGIVTIPFRFEGIRKIKQALEGAHELSKNVDALLVINNERLMSIYSDLEIHNAFSKADDVLLQAAKGISELITSQGYINLDFADVYSTMKDSGVAIMNIGYASGDNRVYNAFKQALNSPLLNNEEIYKSKKILLNIATSHNTTSMQELKQIEEFMDQMVDVEFIWGAQFDDTLGDQVKITLVATGFGNNISVQDLADGKIMVKGFNPTTSDTILEEFYEEKTKGTIDVTLEMLEKEEFYNEFTSVPSYKRLGIKLES